VVRRVYSAAMSTARPLREIRADYDRDTIVVYQAYGPAIAEPALAAQKFVAPFSFQRMTWIKPSFLWLMERSGWGQKAGQEVVLAVRIRRAGWEEALGQAVLTERGASGAAVQVQWDPERSIRGAKLEYRSIQVGLSRHLIRTYAEKWVVAIADQSKLVAKLRKLRKAGEFDAARKLLPPERPYPLSPQLMHRLGIS
jgi:Domain of unknown function (DUF4291)